MRETFKLKLGNLNQAAFAVSNEDFLGLIFIQVSDSFAKSNFNVSLKFQM